MAVRYEWDVELVTTVATDDNDVGEILDHNFCGSYAEAKQRAKQEPEAGFRHQVVLVRDDDCIRSWAYMEDGYLPSHFHDANGDDYAKVPKRFHAEVDKANA